MIPANVRYKRLPGRRRGVFRTGSLWAADDHLLAIDSWRFNEQYKRYYLADIQAITLQRRIKVTPGALALGLLITLAVWLVVILVTTMALLTPVALPRMIGGITAIAAVIAAAVLLYQLISWFFLSCECRIHTSTSSDELRSLHRTWFARRALRRIDEQIRAAQGELPADWESQLAAAQAPLTVTAPAEATTVPEEAAAPASASPAIMVLLAALMAAIAIAGVVAIALQNSIANTLLVLLVIAAAVFAIVGALRSAGRRAGVLRGIATGALLVLLAAYGVATLDGMRQSARRSRQQDPNFSEFLARIDTPWLRRTPAAGASVLGFGGLLAAVLAMRRAREQS
jgi:hypothetical protein